MGFQWLTYNTQTGALGKHSQTSSPMIQTTTVTVGTDVPTVKTTSTNTLTPSTTTTYSNVAPVTLTGEANAPISGLVLTDASGNKWAVSNTTLDASGTASASATCEVTNAAVSVAANGLTISGTVAGLTSVANQASVTTTTTVTIAFDPNLVHAGQAIIGPFDGVTVVMNAAEQAAYDQPQAYLYQSGAFVDNPNYAQIQFNAALSSKLSWLQNTLNSKMSAGFPSSADGTARIYAITGSDSSGMSPMQKWTGILTTIAAGLGQASYSIKDINNNTVTLTQAQFKQFAADGFAYINGSEQTMFVKEAQIKSCTTQAELDTIGWPNPNHPSVPAGLTGTAGTQEVTLSWTANTDVTMIGGSYNVYVNGTKNNTSLITGTSYTVTGLTSGTSYKFSLSAVDTDGNESAQCSVISVVPN